ncbi:hypothetical protein INE88_01002 [Bacteroides eggerthii]|uniref:Uncharacterized protein n=1 Tax=Bacteroides eggerthii TaxID=28111 RepID=A0A975Q562_9BACE|nr:hypothetical protein INE88_01002 [Bacteroides eggerthii]
MSLLRIRGFAHIFVYVSSISGPRGSQRQAECQENKKLFFHVILFLNDSILMITKVSHWYVNGLLAHLMNCYMGAKQF